MHVCVHHEGAGRRRQMVKEGLLEEMAFKLSLKE